MMVAQHRAELQVELSTLTPSYPTLPHPTPPYPPLPHPIPPPHTPPYTSLHPPTHPPSQAERQRWQQLDASARTGRSTGQGAEAVRVQQLELQVLTPPSP